MTRRSVFIVIGAVAAVVVLVITGLLAFRPTSQESAALSPADSRADSRSQAQQGSQSGALIEGTQRSWPDPIDGDIDSQFSTPGQYAAEPLFSRMVFTPNNPVGDLPARETLVDAPGQCEDVSLTGKTQLQYVKARYLVVNSEAGPSRMDKAVPHGYAHSAAGAVVAAINQLGYGLYAQGDEVGEEIDRQLWASSRSAQAERAFKGLDRRGASDLARAQTLPGATAFKMIQCSPDLAIVEVVFGDPVLDSPDATTVARVPLVWRNGDWHADFSGSNDAMLNRPGVDSLDGYTFVEYK